MVFVAWCCSPGFLANDSPQVWHLHWPHISRHNRMSQGTAAGLDVPPQVSRSRRKSGGTAAGHEVLPQVSRFRRKSRGITPQVSRSRRRSPGTAASLEISPQVSRYRHKSRDLTRYRRKSRDLAAGLEVPPQVARSQVASYRRKSQGTSASRDVRILGKSRPRPFRPYLMMSGSILRSLNRSLQSNVFVIFFL